MKLPWTDPGKPSCCCCPDFVFLKCEPRSATKSKCGYSYDGKRWLKKITTESPSSSGTSYLGGNCNCDYSSSLNRVTTVTIALDSNYDCIYPAPSTCEGTASFQSDCSCPDPCSYPTCEERNNSDLTWNPCGAKPDLGFWDSLYGDGSGPFYPRTVSYEDEFTTALLITKTENALPSWPGTYSTSSCTAFRNLSPDQTSLTLREARYRFEIAAAHDRDITVTYQTRFTPEAGGGDTITGPLTTTIPAGQTHSAPIELSLTVDGTDRVEYISHDCA
jgi:hypothetical protein